MTFGGERDELFLEVITVLVQCVLYPGGSLVC